MLVVWEPAYEFYSISRKMVKRTKIRKKVDLYWITPEPFLGHFGIEGMPRVNRMLKNLWKCSTLSTELA